jgi:hypothetical protein
MTQMSCNFVTQGKIRNINCEGRGAKMAPHAEEEKKRYADL